MLRVSSFLKSNFQKDERLCVLILDNYPFAPPYAYAVTLMWHPNIDSSIPPGKLNICLDLINPDLVGKVDASTGASGWTPSKTLINIIEALKGMMHVELFTICNNA